MHRSLSATSCLLVAVLAFSACTSEDPPVPLAPSTRAADAFIDAWNSADGDAMAEMFIAEDAADWETRLDRWLRKRSEEGEITGVTVTRTSTPVQPSPKPTSDEGELPDYDPVEVGYSIHYESEATTQTVALSGSFEMAYEPEDDRWLIDWDPGLMWPGMPDASRFEVSTEWPRRGRIEDRDGRVLARGTGMDRKYPFGTLAGTTMGHLATLTAEGAVDLGDDYREGDIAGGSGLEFAFERQLAGTPTTVLSLLGPDNEPLERFAPVEGTKGRRLRTTLDVEVQRAGEGAYPSSEVGGAVIMQPATGDVLAVIDSSTFDPSNYVGAEGVAPFNRPLVGRYPPGSTMKVVTTAAALDSGLMTPSSRLAGPKEYKGVRNFESEEFSSLTLADALRHSVNTAFAQVAEKLGARKLVRYAHLFGFDREVSFSSIAATSQFPEPVGLGDLMWSSIGQAQVLATPLQMASVAAAIANDGRQMQPRLSLDEPQRGKRIISRVSAAQLTTMMESVVTGGTGTNAQISGASVAGKTGTAEVDVAGKRENHAWFVSFAPSGSPKLAIAVVSEYGGVGGVVAAPIARAIYIRALPVAP